MPEGSFRCRVVTPTAKLLDERVKYVNVPAHDGLMGIAPGRAAIVGKLGLGELRLEFPTERGTADRLYFIHDGFFKMEGDELVVLAQEAIPAETIGEAEAQAELREAEARTVAPDAKDKAAEADRIRLQRERARLKVRIAAHHRGAGKAI